MPKYRNVSGRVVTTPSGKRLGPTSEVVLTMQEAQAMGGALELIGGQQMLVEAPIGAAEAVVEEVEVQPTVSVDLDGDGDPDVELKGEVAKSIFEKVVEKIKG